jgi:hypothetical protein
MAARKHFVGFCAFFVLFASAVYAQTGYMIVATKGSSGLFNKPAIREIKIGQKFLALRKVNGREVEVAKVKVALIERNYCGVKVDEPLADNRLRKGDYLVEPKSNFEETLSFLDGFETPQEPETNYAQTADKPVEESPPLIFDAEINTSPEQVSSEANNQPDGILSADIPFLEESGGVPQIDSEQEIGDVPSENIAVTVSPQNIHTSFLGPSVAFIAPVSNTADVYAAGPKFGLQVLTELGFNTNLRFSAQYAILQPASAIKSSLTSSGASQNSSLAILSASIQPKILNNFILDIGVGYYRQHDEVQTLQRLSSSTKSAVGTLTGLGYHAMVGKASSLMLLATGNFYFLEGNNATYFSMMAGYFFAL